MSTSISFLEQALENGNVKAAIDTIRKCEGTDAPDGCHYLYGSSPNNDLRFTDLSTHPNIHQVHNGINSTAAGLGQWLYSSYEWLCKTYGFTDFSEHTQMLLFCADFDRLNCLAAISKGLFLQSEILAKLSSNWASLPYNDYKQNPKNVAQVREFYLSAGGLIGGGNCLTITLLH